MNWSLRLLVSTSVAISLSGCTYQTQEDARSLEEQIAAVKSSFPRETVNNQADEDTHTLVRQIASAHSTIAQPTNTDQVYEASALLTDDDILEITGAKVLNKKPGDAFGVYENFCTWNLVTDTGVNRKIELSVVSPGGRKYFDVNLALAAEQPISGLGDVAIRHNSGNTAAVKGDTLVELRYVEFPPRPEVPQQLIERTFSRLP